MKITALNQIHKSLGAKMLLFAGFEMPVEYSGINKEHITVRQGVGIFDISHMGDIWIKGPKAIDLLQKITTNDVSKLVPGAAQYSCMPNGKGGIVDDIIVYKYEENKYFVVVNASNMEKDWEWMNRNNNFGAILDNASDRMSQVAVQGPKAISTLQKLTKINLSDIPSFHFVTGTIAGMDNVMITATGYTGAGGMELYFMNEQAETIWNAVMDAGKEFGIGPIGLAARDTLRLEKGYCLYGNDINDATSPIEAGLGWITKFTDYKNFIDKELLKKQKEHGVSKKLVGFEMVDRGIPRQHYEIKDAKGTIIGEVTSGTMSPMMQQGIGMGYVATEFSGPGSEIYIQIRKNLLKAKVVKFPIYKG